MPFSETELVVQMGALDSDSSCHRKIFALLPKTVLVLTYKLINYGGVEAWGRGQLKSQAQSMCFVAWTDGLLSLTSPLQQEHPSRATGLSVPWLADRVSPSSISSREWGGKVWYSCTGFSRTELAHLGQNLSCQATEEYLYPTLLTCPCVDIWSGWDGEGKNGYHLASKGFFPSPWQIRRAFRSIRNTLPEITYVFLLFMFSLLMFSLMALKLFGERCEYCFCSELGGRNVCDTSGQKGIWQLQMIASEYKHCSYMQFLWWNMWSLCLTSDCPFPPRNLQTAEGLPYFKNYLEIVFDLYVLVTTANSPDVMYVCWACSLSVVNAGILLLVAGSLVRTILCFVQQGISEQQQGFYFSSLQGFHEFSAICFINGSELESEARKTFRNDALKILLSEWPSSW